MKIFFFCLMLVFSAFAHAFKISKLTLNGDGCKTKLVDVIQTDPAQNKYEIPLILNIEKKSAKPFERKNCSMVLPLELQKDEKLIVENSHQNLVVDSDKNTVKAQLEVFFAGHHGKVLKIETKNKKSTEVFQQTGVVAESKCGASVNLRAQVSAFVSGSSEAHVSTENLKLELKVIKCL